MSDDYGRPIHDCPYCGRTKFADETLPCCESDFFDMRVQWQRQKDYRDRKPKEWTYDDHGGKMYVSLTDLVGQ